MIKLQNMRKAGFCSETQTTDYNDKGRSVGDRVHTLAPPRPETEPTRSEALGAGPAQPLPLHRPRPDMRPLCFSSSWDQPLSKTPRRSVLCPSLLPPLSPTRTRPSPRAARSLLPSLGTHPAPTRLGPPRRGLGLCRCTLGSSPCSRQAQSTPCPRVRSTGTPVACRARVPPPRG